MARHFRKSDYDIIINNDDDDDDIDIYEDIEAGDLLELNKRKGIFHRIVRYAAIIAFVLTVSMVIAASITKIKNRSSSSSSVATSNDDYTISDDIISLTDETLSYTLKRTGYDPLDFFTVKKSKYIKYEHLHLYNAVIEPHGPMELYIESDLIDNDFEYEYTVCTYDSDTAAAGTDCITGIHTIDASISFTIECTPYDKYYITVTEKYKGMTVTRTSSILALCQYIRREIRTLTDDDLSDALDAMHAIWKYSEDAGQLKYGSDFHSSSYFSEIHNFNAAQRDSDHIHEGMGFLPQHFKMTNIFETSMQSVDPSVTLFYWDYTVDVKEGLKLNESPMFTEDTFGSLNYAEDDYWGWTYANDSLKNSIIPDGRWKRLTVEVNNKYEDLGNSFGYMRAPWNFNPSQYISRFAGDHASLPSCKSFALLVEYTDFPSFMYEAAFTPHGSTHGAIGNVYGCDLFAPLVEKGMLTDTDTAITLCSKWPFMVKEMYRGNLISRAETSECTIMDFTYDGIDCKIVCDSTKLTEIQSYLKQNLKASVPSSFKDYSLWSDWLCTGDSYKVFVGDHLESASPSDPSFWPIHPNLER